MGAIWLAAANAFPAHEFELCYMLQVPSPREVSDEEVQELVKSGDGTKFRVPLSLGEPHTEKDNC